MKLSLLLATFMLLPWLLKAQSTNQVVIGQIDSLQSKNLNEKRKIWVHIPDSYRNDTYTKQRYPVVYLLDAASHFSSVVGMIEQLSSVNGNMVCPEMIVVGIPNTNRTRDLTPTRVAAAPPFDSSFAANTGGEEAFTAFIERELIPYVDAHYPTLPYKLLIGHSLGGLLAINTLVHHPSLFNAYMAIDPSMWWDKRKLLTQTKQEVTHQAYPNVSLYVGIANTMAKSLDTLSVQRDTTSATNHIRSILTLDHLLRTTKPKGLRYQSRYYGNDSHGSVALIAEYDALHFLFDFYDMPSMIENIFDPNVSLSDKFTNHFAMVSKRMGCSVKPPEAIVDELVNNVQTLKTNYPQKVESMLKLNLENYPQSYHAHEAYGDYCVTRKDTANAIAQFQQSLALKETVGVRKKLTDLQAKARTGSSLIDEPKK